MIKFKDVSTTLNGRMVLDNVSGHFKQGQVNLVIGSSGVGKSVLIKCIVGLIQPERGSIMLDGRDILHGGRELILSIRRELGMLFQGTALFDSKNVEENVIFPLDMLTKLTKQEKLDRANFCLERVGLKNANKKMPAELSGGMRKQVGIARAIVNKPKYLFCDEPNSGLDPRTALLIDELIKELTYEYNITTVVVTHDMDSVVMIGNYILFLDQGKKAWEGAAADIFRTELKVLQDFLFASRLMQLVKERL